MHSLPNIRKMTEAEVEQAVTSTTDPQTFRLLGLTMKQSHARLSGFLVDGQPVVAIVGSGGDQVAELHFLPFTARCLRLVKYAPYLAGLCGAAAFYTTVYRGSPAEAAMTRVLLKEGWEPVPGHDSYFMQLYDL